MYLRNNNIQDIAVIFLGSFQERGMLKEAILEKKVHAPLKEIRLERLPGERSTEKHQNAIQVRSSTPLFSFHEYKSLD